MFQGQLSMPCQGDCVVHDIKWSQDSVVCTVCVSIVCWQNLPAQPGVSSKQRIFQIMLTEPQVHKWISQWDVGMPRSSSCSCIWTLHRNILLMLCTPLLSLLITFDHLSQYMMVVSCLCSSHGVAIQAKGVCTPEQSFHSACAAAAAYPQAQT